MLEYQFISELEKWGCMEEEEGEELFIDDEEEI